MTISKSTSSIFCLYMYSIISPHFPTTKGIALRALADKVISPCIGWDRSYHSYCFLDVKDGSVFGPLEGQGVDFCFLPYHGHLFLSDKSFRLGDLINEAGDVMEYVHDLGIIIITF